MEPALSAGSRVVCNGCSQLDLPAPPGNGRARRLILEHKVYEELEHQARYGMLPLSWGFLGRGLSSEDAYAGPLEMLLVQQLADDEQAKLLRERYGLLGAEFEHQRRLAGHYGWQARDCWRDFDELPQAKQLTIALRLLAAASRRRNEQARHYGMLLTRAFFKTESEKLLLNRLPQELETCIEQFLLDGSSTVWPFRIVLPKLPPWLDPCDGKPDSPIFLVGELARWAPELGSVQICRGRRGLE